MSMYLDISRVSSSSSSYSSYLRLRRDSCCSTRRIVYIIARAHGEHRGGEGAVGGEFDRRIFNAIKNKPLPLARALSSLALGLRPDATRRTLLHPNGNKLRIFREIFIASKRPLTEGDASRRHQHVATCLWQPTARSIVSFGDR